MTASSTAATGILPDGLEQAWRARTVELPGGHLGWIGARDQRGVPVLTHHGARYTAARVAYLIRHSAWPVGQVKAGCDHAGCLHPDHVDDYPRRQQDRAALRTVIGTRPWPARCRRAGHDQAVHGAIRADGRHYCHACAHPSRHWIPCGACGKPVPVRGGPGRPARYCNAACGQRAYRVRAYLKRSTS